ncbi:MAG: hypothetical protein Tsb009_15810 [Planctomycetaceae bacterium]
MPALPPHVELPVLPQAAIDFSRRSQDPNVTVDELGKIIEKDSGLTCDLLKHVNSSAFGLRHKVVSVNQAIVAISIQQCRLFLLKNCLEKELLKCRSEFIDPYEFAAVNLERALFAREVAKLLNANTDLAYTAAMMMDFVLPMATHHFGREYFQHLQMPESSRTTLVEFEQNTFGWDHAYAAAQVMLSWEFPDDLICCVLLHHRGLKLFNDKQLRKTAANAVALAACIPDSLDQMPHGLSLLTTLASQWPAFDLKTIANTVYLQYEEMTTRKTDHEPFLHRLDSLAAAR